MLRHDEKAGLMEARRAENGYRRSTGADLRRAGRIRDLIATGVSTREVLAIAPCLSDKGGIPQLMKKLEQIDRLRADPDAKREAVLERLAVSQEALSSGSHAAPLPAKTGSALPSVTRNC